VTTYLVYETGGIRSGLVLLYVITILLSTLLLLSRGAIASTIFACLGFVSVSALTDGATILSNPSSLSRLFLVASVLSFIGGALAYFSRYRERLASSLQSTTSKFKDLSELYSAIIDHSPSGIMCLGKDSRDIQVMNLSAQRILGQNLSGQGIERTSLRGMVLAENERREAFFNVGGQEKVLGYQVSLLPNGDWLIVFQDLTEIRHLEDRVRLKEKLATVGQLAAGIAHEIRNPLASLSGSVQLLKSEMPANSGSEKLMTIVLRETDRLDALIKNFLVYAKPSELKLEDVHVSSIVNEIVELIRHQKKQVMEAISIRNDVPASIVCRCDGRQLKQILWNLVLNGVDSMKKGGALLISGSIREVEKRSIVHIGIRDQGEGIPESIKDRIFDPFFTTKSEGTGLGLALVYQMVKAHGGNIGLETEIGRGTEFWIDLYQDGPTDTERKVA